jgi:hypothetical protein
LPVVDSTAFPFEFEVTSPFWRFTDGNVSWHITRYPQTDPPPSTLNKDGVQFEYSLAPARLIQLADGITPPNGGRPYGMSLTGDLGCIHDIRHPWRSGHAWDSLRVEICGPCDIVFYASVLQTNPATRRVMPNITGANSSTFTPEDFFVSEFDNTDGAGRAVYHRIAGSLIFEEACWYPPVDNRQHPPERCSLCGATVPADPPKDPQ